MLKSLRILPDLLRLPSAADGALAFSMFLFIYAGLAFGLLRYRLPQAKAWNFRILFAALATALLWIADATIIYAPAIDQGPALGLHHPDRSYLSTGTGGGRVTAAPTAAFSLQ